MIETLSPKFGFAATPRLQTRSKILSRHTRVESHAQHDIQELLLLHTRKSHLGFFNPRNRLSFRFRERQPRFTSILNRHVHALRASEAATDLKLVAGALIAVARDAFRSLPASASRGQLEFHEPAKRGSRGRGIVLARRGLGIRNDRLPLCYRLLWRGDNGQSRRHIMWLPLRKRFPSDARRPRPWLDRWQ